MSIESHYKSWIATNLIRGKTPDQLNTAMMNSGLSAETVNAAIADAVNHPYIEAGKEIYATLKKREALLKTLDYQKKNSSEYLEIKKIPLPPFADFLSHYYYENRIGLFSDAINHWKAKSWTLQSLVEKVGADTIVEIQQGRDEDKKYESNSNNLKHKIPFGEFINNVESVESNNFYLTANNHALSNSKLKILLDDMGNISDGYLDPTKLGQNTHLWIGPKGTITPLHHDLTNNLFVQITGRKKFVLIPAMQVPYLYNNHHVFSDVDYINPQLKKYARFKLATPIEFEIEAGDMLFIPIGWWHHVTGLTPNISVSFTNFNLGFNGFIDY